MTGFIPYDLIGNWCSECGRAKSFRLFPGTLTGCSECDAVISRHRCIRRPELELGQAWECPDCDSIWTLDAIQEKCPDCCDDCDHEVTVKHWDYIPGDRIDSAPKHVPQSYAPFRNPFPRCR